MKLADIHDYAATTRLLRAMRTYIGHPTAAALQFAAPCGVWVRCCHATPCSAGVLLRGASAASREALRT